MGIFDAISEAQVYGGGRYITPGKYELKVKELKTFESTKAPGRHYFAAEFEVVETTAEDYVEGDVVTWLVNMDNKQTSANNLLAFALALSPENKPEDISPQVMEDLVAPEQPACGILMKADAFLIKTRAGNDFTKVNWYASN